MVILGAGVIALEMAQSFARFGSQVTVIQRSKRLFASKQGDAEAAEILQQELEKSGVTFLSGLTKQVTTLRERPENTEEHPLMKVTVGTDSGDVELDCECLLVATGRVANVENLGLEEAGVEYSLGKGITVNDFSQSVSNPNIYAVSASCWFSSTPSVCSILTCPSPLLQVGDCVADVPRLTHMSGEMAKLVVQNSLFKDSWKLSSLVVPAVMYTEPEYGTVGISSAEMADKKGVAVDTYRAGLEHNGESFTRGRWAFQRLASGYSHLYHIYSCCLFLSIDRAITESANVGFCKIFCKEGTDEIVGACIVAERAGEMINEVSLAMKNNLGLRAIGRNIHSYPTTGEAVMGCGIQYINSHWERLD
jgi:pyruvate/2-oxoglutarate dehydrogenase complex dihydrolipoamide dehydrogenase (E3) component